MKCAEIKRATMFGSDCLLDKNGIYLESEKGQIKCTNQKYSYSRTWLFTGQKGIY